MKQPICSRCKRPLSDPLSVAIGMGPECRGGLSKKGWKFPKPIWRTRNGHVELVGMSGKVEPPTVNTDAVAKISKEVKHDSKSKN